MNEGRTDLGIKGGLTWLFPVLCARLILSHVLSFIYAGLLYRSVLLQFTSQYRLNPESDFEYYRTLRSFVRKINKHLQVTLQHK